MRASSYVALIALAAAGAAAALAPGCSSGDRCIRHTDCSTGLVCIEGTCQIDPESIPADASSERATPGDAIVPDTTGGSADVTRSETSQADLTTSTDVASADGRSDGAAAGDADAAGDVDAAGTDAAADGATLDAADAEGG